MKLSELQIKVEVQRERESERGENRLSVTAVIIK